MQGGVYFVFWSIFFYRRRENTFAGDKGNEF